VKLSAVPLLLSAALCACNKTPVHAVPTKIVAAAPAFAGDPLGGRDTDPMVPTQAGYPFPSSVYLVDDATTPTKKHVQFRPTTLPVIGGEYTVPLPFARSDGFSAGSAVLTHLPGATSTGLPTQDFDGLSLSVTTKSPTILLEVNADGSFRLMPHFAELDRSTYADPAEQTFIMRPVERLKDATRYIVAIRHVVDKDGKPLAPNPVFQALRDGTASSDASVAPRRALYQNILDNLQVAGIDPKDLQLAWDYSTASRDNNTRDMIAMRDAALAVVGAQGPEYTITAVTEAPNQWIARRIEGTFHAPLYLTAAVPGSRINRGPDGLPLQNGFADYPFLVQIPNSVATGTAPAAVLQQGHGLLGSRNEARDGMFARFADEKKYVTIAIDMTGFAHDDVGIAENVIQEDIGNFLGLVEPQHQGFINELLAMRMMIGRFVNEPKAQYNGHSVIDPMHRYYRGDSQGGIMGATYMAISTDVTRGYLGEPGMPYNMLLNRSHDFDGYMFLIRQAYPTPREPQLLLGLMQMLWDRSEPDGYAPYLSHDMLPNTPKHAVIINDAIGDFQVTPLGAHILARAVGAQNLKPVNRHLFGIDEVDGPLAADQSGMTEFDFQLDKNVDVSLPLTDLPPAVTGTGDHEGGQSVDCDPHDKVRDETPVFLQEDQFFRTGVIQNFCTGQSLRPPDATKPGSCAYDFTIPYVAQPNPTACTPG
jgi:hypothetical protein